VSVAKELIVILPMPGRVKWRIYREENAAIQRVITSWTWTEGAGPNGYLISSQESGFANRQHLAWHLDLALGNWWHAPKYDRPHTEVFISKFLTDTGRAPYIVGVTAKAINASFVKRPNLSPCSQDNEISCSSSSADNREIISTTNRPSWQPCLPSHRHTMGRRDQDSTEM
jgi:hypothetical protein